MNVRRLTPVLLAALAALSCGTDGTDGSDGPTAATAATGASPPSGTSPTSTGPPTLDALPVATASDRRPVVVDYSPTSSDVAALMYVAEHPAADLLAVTLAGTGESHCERAIANTQSLLAAIGRADIPVACGQEQPVGPGSEWPADWRASADRLDGLELPTAPGEDAGDAADLLASIATDNGPITIIALGPLTNLAVAAQRHGEFTSDVERVVTMGGAVEVDGNATNGVAEWNYFIDPTAVDTVLRSGVPVTMVPLDATDDVPVTSAWFDRLAAHRTTAAAGIVHDLFAASRPWEFGFYFWDELAAAVALDEGVVTLDERPISIELSGPEQGRTRVDPVGTTVRVATDADAARFEDDLLTTLNGGAEPPELPAATPEQLAYFGAVDEATGTLSGAIEQLFRTPAAEAVAEIADRGDAGPIGPEDEAVLREFFTTFWTDGLGHLAEFRDELARLDPPSTADAEHDEYVAALGALIDDGDRRIADVRTHDAAELPTMFWEPDELIEAVNTACAALDAAAARVGLDIESCP